MTTSNDDYKCRSGENADRLEGKIDNIVDQVGNINVTLAKQHASIEEHIRRTNILEEKLIPIEKKFYEISGIVRLGGWVVGLLSVVVGLLKIIEYFKH